MPLPAPRPIREVARHVAGPLTGFGVAVSVRVAAIVALPSVVAAAVDAATTGRDLRHPVLQLVAVLVLSGLAEVSVTTLNARTTGRGTAWLRARVTAHLLALGPQGRFGTGDAVTRVVHASADTAAVPVAVVGNVVALLSAAAGIVLLWVLDPAIGLAFTVVVPPAVLVSRRFFGDVADLQRDYLDAQSRMAGRLVTALGGIRTIRAAGTVARETTRVLAPLPELGTAGRAMWAVQRRAGWRLGLTIALAQLLVLAVAGWSVGAGRITTGGLLAAVGYVAVAMGLFDQIASLQQLGRARAAARRVAEVLAEPAPVTGSERLGPGPGAVSLVGITLTRGDATVLDRLDLDIPAGSSVAVVGRSGAGKSALAALVGRLTDPDAGEVRLDGTPVHRITGADLHAAVGYAFGAPVLVGNTVADAIGYGRADLDRRAVVAAARSAGADGFLGRLPDGYDTALDAVPLSGGELQRIGLARAFARDARVLVLDDATSGLDAATEALVTGTVTDPAHGRTRLVVTHRAATAAACDLVAWIDDGRVVALGPHERLRTDPGYRAVFADATDPGEQP